MRFINFFFKVYLVIYDDFYDEKEFYNKKFLKLLVFEKNVFFEKLGLSANPDCRGNRIISDIFFQILSSN